MDATLFTRIDVRGNVVEIAPFDIEAALRDGEALHRAFRPHIGTDYAAHIHRMADEGAGILQLVDDGEVRSIAVWRHYLTTYAGRRFEIDDLVTAEGHRSKGYGASMLRALEAKAKFLACNAVMLSSATHRTAAPLLFQRAICDRLIHLCKGISRRAWFNRPARL